MVYKVSSTLHIVTCRLLESTDCMALYKFASLIHSHAYLLTAHFYSESHGSKSFITCFIFCCDIRLWHFLFEYFICYFNAANSSYLISYLVTIEHLTAIITSIICILLLFEQFDLITVFMYFTV